MRGIGTFALLLVMIWGATYVPFTDQYALNLITTPQQTVRLPADDLSPGESFSDDKVDDACQHVPFLVRPIAKKPNSVKVVFTVSGDDLGEIVVSCRDGSLISERLY